MKWSELSLAKKVFTVATCILTLAGVEYGLFKDWSTAPIIEHTAAILINAGIVGYSLYLGVKAAQA